MNSKNHGLYEVCKRCQGTGKYVDDPCIRCDGSGEVVWTRNIIKSELEKTEDRVIRNASKNLADEIEKEILKEL